MFSSLCDFIFCQEILLWNNLVTDSNLQSVIVAFPGLTHLLFDFVAFPGLTHSLFDFVAFPGQTHYLGLVGRKPDFVAWEQQISRSACTSAQSDCRLCYSLSAKYIYTCFMKNFNNLASL